MHLLICIQVAVFRSLHLGRLSNHRELHGGILFQEYCGIIFDAMDRDKSGVLEYEEFNAAMSPLFTDVGKKAVIKVLSIHFIWAVRTHSVTRRG